MEIPLQGRRRHGISGVIGAVIMFTMLFTIGSEYFIFINNANNLSTQALVNRANSLSTRLQEAMTITTSLSASNYLEFYFNNTGGVAVNVTSLMLMSSAGVILACDGLALPSGQGCTTSTPSMPLVANPGRGAPRSGYAVTGYQYPTSTTPIVTLKLITSNGNIFVQTYPETGVSLAAQALSSGAIGDLYLAFQSYHYYTVTTGNGCPTGGSYSGYCLNDQGKAFAIDHANTGPNYNVGFSVQITDLNQQKANIVLDPYTLMSLVPESGKGSLSYTNWFIVSNTSTGGFNSILLSYTDVVLKYDVPQVVVFAASAPQLSGVAYSGTYLQATGAVAAGTTTPVFMVSHGCEAAGITSCAITGGNYGQNSPYVTTLFY
ncbi:MAG: hypothetical protein JRM99_06010 [Nitrososphaerota archaeon]|nr:hypothetical protein [Nitrososphaerota archaeon]